MEARFFSTITIRKGEDPSRKRSSHHQKAVPIPKSFEAHLFEVDLYHSAQTKKAI
jgi:hypothetical protein